MWFIVQLLLFIFIHQNVWYVAPNAKMNSSTFHSFACSWFQDLQQHQPTLLKTLRCIVILCIIIPWEWIILLASKNFYLPWYMFVRFALKHDFSTFIELKNYKFKLQIGKLAIDSFIYTLFDMPTLFTSHMYKWTDLSLQRESFKFSKNMVVNNMINFLMSVASIFFYIFILALRHKSKIKGGKIAKIDIIFCKL